MYLSRFSKKEMTKKHNEKDVCKAVTMVENIDHIEWI